MNKEKLKELMLMGVTNRTIEERKYAERICDLQSRNCGHRRKVHENDVKILNLRFKLNELTLKREYDRRMTSESFK